MNEVIKLRFMHGEAKIICRLNLFNAEQGHQTAQCAQGFKIIARIGVVEWDKRKVRRLTFDGHKRLFFCAQRLRDVRMIIKPAVFTGGVKLALGARRDASNAGVGDGAALPGASQKMFGRLIAKAIFFAGKGNTRSFFGGDAGASEKGVRAGRVSA